MGNKINKTGSHQCTPVCSTFAEIHSTLTPQCIDALFGVIILFQSPVQSPEGNPNSSPPVQSPFMFTQVTERLWEIHSRDLPIFILRHEKRLVFLLHLALFLLVGLSKRKIIEPSLTAFTGFPFVLVFTCTFSECVNCHGKSNHSREKQFAHDKSKSTQNEVFYSGGHSALEFLLFFTAGHRYHSPCFPLTLASRVTANIVLCIHVLLQRQLAHSVKRSSNIFFLIQGPRLTRRRQSCLLHMTKGTKRHKIAMQIIDYKIGIKNIRRKAY